MSRCYSVGAVAVNLEKVLQAALAGLYAGFRARLRSSRLALSRCDGSRPGWSD